MKKTTLPALALLLLFSVSAQAQLTQTNTPPSGRIWGIAFSGNGVIYAAGQTNSNGYGGIFHGNDRVRSVWDNSAGNDTGLDTAAYHPTQVFSYKDILLVGTAGKGGIFKSSKNLPFNWQNVTPANAGNIYNDFHAFGVSEPYIYAGLELSGGSSNGVFRSNDQGDTWKAYNNGLAGKAKNIHQFGSRGADLYAATGNGIWKLTGNSGNWVEIGLDGENVLSFTFGPDYMVAGCASGFIYYSPFVNPSFQSFNSGMPKKPVESLQFLNGVVYAGHANDNMVYFTPNGSAHLDPNLHNAWNNTSAAGFSSIYVIRSGDNHLYVGTDKGVWKY